MRCCGVLFAVFSASRTQHSEKYTHYTYYMLPHHRITYNDLVLLPKLNLIQLKLGSNEGSLMMVVHKDRNT